MKFLHTAAHRVAYVLGDQSSVVRNARPAYEYALAFLAGSRGLPWTINGVEFRVDPRHRHRMGRVYDPEIASFLAGRVRPGSTCLDVGANVGVYALQFARWTGPSGRVVAFEPNPIAAAVLAEHVRMNDLQGLIQVVPGAVADHEGTSVLHMADADGMSRLGKPNPEIAAHTQPTAVRVRTLDDFCAEGALSPDWLLIDVEGFEFAVLAGGRRTLARRGDHLNVVVEMHPNAWDVAGWSRATGEALLDELGLVPTSLSGLADPLGTYGHVLLRPRPAPGVDV